MKTEPGPFRSGSAMGGAEERTLAGPRSLVPLQRQGVATMAFALPSLPYDRAALMPHISAETFDFHHGKHHQAYIDKTNELLEKAGLRGRTLVEIVRQAREMGDQTLFNNAAQAWNHSFFWQCLAPSETRPSRRLAELIERD